MIKLEEQEIIFTTCKYYLRVLNPNPRVAIEYCMQ